MVALFVGSGFIPLDFFQNISFVYQDCALLININFRYNVYHVLYWLCKIRLFLCFFLLKISRKTGKHSKSNKQENAQSPHLFLSKHTFFRLLNTKNDRSVLIFLLTILLNISGKFVQFLVYNRMTIHMYLYQKMGGLQEKRRRQRSEKLVFRE